MVTIHASRSELVCLRSAEKIKHHEKQLKAEQYNHGIDKVIAADQSQTLGDMDITSRPQKLFVPPWDAAMATDSITATNRRYKSLKARSAIVLHCAAVFAATAPHAL